MKGKEGKVMEGKRTGEVKGGDGKIKEQRPPYIIPARPATLPTLAAGL